jgi:hypothetical protein
MSQIYSTLVLAVRFIEAGCEEVEVAHAVVSHLNKELNEAKEIMDGEIEFLSKKTLEEEYMN